MQTVEKVIWEGRTEAIVEVEKVMINSD